MNYKKLLLLIFPYFTTLSAQNINQIDSTVILKDIVVNAYENSRKLIDVPAAISLVSNTDLNRFSNTSILSAMNDNPGVRMEERSPGSYRLSIRGSSLTSPFGVRNVKVYYDGIPYTDPSGNTYLNQLGFYNFQSIEIIKGPAGSIYGAGTGGVVLIQNNTNVFHPEASLAYQTGSYNLNNVNVHFATGTDNSHNILNYQHQTSDGYRDHTAMRRDVVTWDAYSKPTARSELQAHFLYADLYYQTPGALTLSEFEKNPKASRPAAAGLPSADQSQAAFYQKTFIAGFSYENDFAQNWKNTTYLYGAYTKTENPSFRNYGRTTEPHFGGRTVFEYQDSLPAAVITFNTGAEFQQSYNTQRIYDNNNGQTDSLQTDDEIFNYQGFVFAQFNLSLNSGWIFTAGASFNKYGLNFTRLSDIPPVNENRKFNNEFTPRLAILKKITKSVSAYGSIANAFSPPTTSEILPSTNIFNTTLQAEKGFDFEFGSRGSLINNKMYYDINAFFYKIKNSIVQRQDANGADYFVNAGSGTENGLETLLAYELANNPSAGINHAVIRLSDTWDDFHYKDFVQLNAIYSGNKLPGVATQTLTTGFDISSKPGIYANINFFYSSRIALNDANTAYANPYGLLGARLGYKSRTVRKKIQWEIFAGADNILNEKYSLGDDINAAGGRYYNAAATRNYYAGISLGFNQ
jgi:iron complex outermembrane recepter protein